MTQNITNREQYYVAFLTWENGGRYMIGMKAVAAHQTIEIDVKKLRDEQTQDETGQVIPLDISKGQFRWSLKRTITPAPGEEMRDSLALAGRTEQIDVENGISSNYACQNWCDSNYHSSYLTPANSQLEAGETTTFNVFQQDYDHYGILTGYYLRIQILHGSTYWNSNTTSVATINSSSALASAVSPGTTTLTATWQDYTAPEYTMCEPFRVGGKADEDGKPGDDLPPQRLGPGDPCDACLTYTVFPTPSVVLAVRPTVTITQIKAVGKNEIASVRVLIANNPGNVPVTLTLSAIPQTTGEARFTSTNTSTRQITQTTNVEIKGITESSTKRSMRLEAKYTDQNNQVVTLKTMDFTVINATLSLRYLTTDTVSSDNSARANYISTYETSNLGGPRLRPGLTGHWVNAIEIAATIIPSDFDELLTIQRVFNQQLYGNQNLLKTYLSCPDTSGDFMLDKDPQSNGSQGKVYDLDAPGFSISDGQPPGVMARARTNFTQWVSVSQPHGENTVPVRVSGNIFWFERLSIVKNTGSGTSLINDVSNDNILGTGATILTWNLTGGGLPPPSDPCPTN